LTEIFSKTSGSPWPPLATAPDNYHLPFFFLKFFLGVNDLVLLSDWEVLLLVMLSFKRVLAALAIGTLLVYKIAEEPARIFY
jgi:hypothetical protein